MTKCFYNINTKETKKKPLFLKLFMGRILNLNMFAPSPVKLRSLGERNKLHQPCPLRSPGARPFLAYWALRISSPVFYSVLFLLAGQVKLHLESVKGRYCNGRAVCGYKACTLSLGWSLYDQTRVQQNASVALSALSMVNFSLSS